MRNPTDLRMSQIPDWSAGEVTAGLPGGDYQVSALHSDVLLGLTSAFMDLGCPALSVA